MCPWEKMSVESKKPAEAMPSGGHILQSGLGIAKLGKIEFRGKSGWYTLVGTKGE